MSKVVQRFEHSTLSVGDGLSADHFTRLVRYNERHGYRYYKIGLNRITFGSYVGVIQVGDLTIEILPKAGRVDDTPATRTKWQGALTTMLRRAGFLRVASTSDAPLRLRSASLLDIYFQSFLAEVADLVHQGLVRRYRPVCDNLPVLKGRILFAEHLARNLTHGERFYTSHVHYDRDNPFNRVLLAALRVLIDVSRNASLVRTAGDLTTWFDDVSEAPVTEDTFLRLAWSRNTERYRRATDLARLILLNYSPDVQHGREQVLAILFDMNVLFERFVYASLRRSKHVAPRGDLVVDAQQSLPFWSSGRTTKSIRPDIVARVGKGAEERIVVVDTKWKLPSSGRPNDADLQQLHAYNVQLGAQEGFLLYPKVPGAIDVRGAFKRGEALRPTFGHECHMVFVDLFDGDGLRLDLGDAIVKTLALDAGRAEA